MSKPFLKATLTRQERQVAAVVIIRCTSRWWGNCPSALADIDDACKAVGIWPHALPKAKVDGVDRRRNGGHGILRLSRENTRASRNAEADGVVKWEEQVVFKSYDDPDFAYCEWLRTRSSFTIEYRPARRRDGEDADDVVMADLAKHARALHAKT